MIRYQRHAYAVKDAFGLKIRNNKISVWGSEFIEKSSFSYSPFRINLDSVSITMQHIENSMVLTKWDERLMEETITLKFPDNKLLTDTNIAKIPELLYYLFIGLDDFGYSAEPVNEVPVLHRGKEPEAWNPAIKKVSVKSLLGSIHQEVGINYSIECEFPFCATLELQQ